jgi:CHAT domain-containing protein
VERAARDLYTSWSTLASTPADAARELALSQLILGSARDSLRDKHRLIIVPDGDLKSIPFGALLLDSARTRLMDTHEIAYRPTVAPGRTDTSETANVRSARRMLLVGDPTASAGSVATPGLLTDPWAWQPLPGSRREIASIEQIATGWDSYVLLGAQGTKQSLLNLPLETFHTIHFATHARLDVLDPQLSSIVLSSGDANVGSSTLSVREIVGFKLSADVVVLSACEGSLGKDYRGQLSFGLSEAFLLAGARNVLGSLWRVSDEAAQAYMQHFYREYVQHDTEPARAAQVAARALSRQAEFAHPFFWAPFVVTQQ